MCDRKNEGGRCFPHKEGTQALIEMTENLTDLPQDHIKKTAKELKQEGKTLPAPSEEEVVALAMTNKFTARYDPRIPENKREKYIRKWQKAEKENPNGGEFHSWKHTMVESVKRYKRTAVAALLGGSIMLTSACGLLPNNNNNNPAPTPEVTISAPASPTTSATASPKPTESTISETLKKQGLESTGKVLKNSKGSYPELKLNEKSPLMKWDESKNNSDKGITAGWTKKDVEEAQQFASKFIVNKMIDSPANGDPSYSDQWVKENKELLHPDYREDLIESAKSKGATSFVIKESWQSQANSKNYGYVYDGKTPRLKNLDIDVVSSENISDKGMYFDYAGNYTMNAKSDSGTTEQYTDVQNIGISVVKEKDKFYVAGVFTTTNTADNS